MASPAPQLNNDLDDDSFSSDSDDEFLMRQNRNAGGGAGAGAAASGGTGTAAAAFGNNADREAMVRKKLLESFYGKSAVSEEGDKAATSRRHRHGVDTADDYSRDTSDDDDDDDDYDYDDDDGNAPMHGHSASAAAAAASKAKAKAKAAEEEDLDAPQFNAAAHTHKHVLHDGVHPLLEIEEGLACQVRTLDSSLQTLVYENYSRFIDATDAIRSIGTQIEAHQSDSRRRRKKTQNNTQTTTTTTTTQLQHTMNVVAEASRSVETAVGPVRDQVVEKLRVQRLLQRLDTVLKLPTTLQKQIRRGQYRAATQSYVSAYSILAKHSMGFESLQRIETECHAIMTQLLQEVRQKLIHWSGGLVPEEYQHGEDEREYDDDDDHNDDDHHDDDDHDDHDNDDHDDGPVPDPPQSISDIMECAGTSVMILLAQQEQQLRLLQQQGLETTGTASSSSASSSASASASASLLSNGLDPRLTVHDCQDMALSAGLRFLERILDMHHIELQEQQQRQLTLSSSFEQQQQQQRTSSSSSNSNSKTNSKTNSDAALEDAAAAAAQSALLNIVPTGVLDSILEVSTLYSMTFSATISSTATTTGTQDHGSAEDQRLAQFVSNAFGNFLQHVRSELLEQAMLQQQHATQARAVAAKTGKSSSISSSSSSSKPSKNNRHQKTPSQDAADLMVADAEAHAEEQSDQYDEQTAAAMATLLLSVRQLASALTTIVLPQHSRSTTTTTTNGGPVIVSSIAAIDPELASGLVDQTVGLTEAMVRRRVDQKFDTLRLRVIEDCLTPFCQAVRDMMVSKDKRHDHEEINMQPPPLLGAVQLASVALSDSLQLVDDTVRSILSTLEEGGGQGKGRTTGDGDDDDYDDYDDEDSMLREAVEHSTKRFAKWLASAMEQLAGYESSSDPKVLLQAAAVRPDTGAGEEDNRHHTISPYYGDATPMTGASKNLMNEDDYDDDANMSQMSVGPSGGMVETELLDLVNSSEPTLEMVLAIAEMCRVAERSVMDNIHQSILTHGGGSGPIGGGGPGSGGIPKRKISATARGDGLFSGDEQQSKNRKKNPISERFRLAASRVLSLFAMNQGHEAATLFCSTLPELSAKQNEASMVSLEGPRPVIFQVLELAKVTSLDCADLFGGKRRAGPIPDSLEDEYASLTSSRMSSSNNRSGLAFDVERMFAETVVAYPHPNDIAEFQRNAVVAMLFRVAFKALIENARLLRFSVQGYRQLKVDIEFLRWFLPHFVKDEALSDGSNAQTALNSLLTEVIQTVKDRCVGDGLYQDVEETNQARATIRRYMSLEEGRPSFCIDEDYK